MEAVMRNGVVGGLLCLVGLQSQINCQVNWKNSKVSCKLSGNLKHLRPPVDMDVCDLVSVQNVHHQRTQQLGKTITTTEDLSYFANNLMNERNFVKNLDAINIVRTVGSEGSKKVRNVSLPEMMQEMI